MKTWAILIAFIAMVALVIGAAVAGWSFCKYRTERGLAEEVQRLERDRADLERQIGEMAVAMSEKRETVRTVYRTITREVERRERETPDAECFGPDDVRLLNKAARGQYWTDISTGPR